MSEAALDAHHQRLILFVAHHDALERSLRHISFPQLLARLVARLAAAGLAEPVTLAVAEPWRFDTAIVFSRAMSRRTSRTRAVFSNWPLARWKRRLKCSFLSLSTSSSI